MRAHEWYAAKLNATTPLKAAVSRWPQLHLLFWWSQCQDVSDCRSVSCQWSARRKESPTFLPRRLVEQSEWGGCCCACSLSAWHYVIKLSAVPYEDDTCFVMGNLCHFPSSPAPAYFYSLLLCWNWRMVVPNPGSPCGICNLHVFQLIWLIWAPASCCCKWSNPQAPDREWPVIAAKRQRTGSWHSKPPHRACFPDLYSNIKCHARMAWDDDVM